MVYYSWSVDRQERKKKTKTNKANHCMEEFWISVPWFDFDVVSILSFHSQESIFGKQVKIKTDLKPVKHVYFCVFQSNASNSIISCVDNHYFVTSLFEAARSGGGFMIKGKVCYKYFTMMKLALLYLT